MENKEFVSACCGGERCSMCGKPAARKVGEEIFHDDPHPIRHNLTAYVCLDHFNMIMDRGGWQARAALADWQPIETAPKDGTRILLIASGWSNTNAAERGYWERQPYHKKPKPYWQYDRWNASTSREHPPTHWMPLPPAPLATEVG